MLWFLIAGLLLVLFLVFISGSRSGFLALVIEGIFFLCYSQFKISIGKTIAIVFCCFILVMMLPFFEEERAFENRIEIWQTAVASGFENPIIGSGFGSIERSLRLASEKMSNNVRFQYVDSAHNVFLDWWVQGGVLGLGAIAFLIGRSIFTFFKNRQALLIIVFFGILTTMSFNPSSVVTLLMFWYLIGRGNFQNEIENEHSP
jgi:O-antigen ligase